MKDDVLRTIEYFSWMVQREQATSISYFMERKEQEKKLKIFYAKTAYLIKLGLLTNFTDRKMEACSFSV